MQQTSPQLRHKPIYMTQIDEKAKLFIVQFGTPDIIGSIHIGTAHGLTELFVIAKSYDEAAIKALAHALEKTDKQSIVQHDGSLCVAEQEIKVKAVKLACEEFVW